MLEFFEGVTDDSGDVRMPLPHPIRGLTVTTAPHVCVAYGLTDKAVTLRIFRRNGAPVRNRSVRLSVAGEPGDRGRLVT